MASIGLFIYLIIVAFYVSEMEPPDLLGERKGTISRFIRKPSETMLGRGGGGVDYPVNFATGAIRN